MVQTRSAAKKSVSGDPSPEKKRVYRPPAPKRRHRGKPGEMCQLNLDVLFLIAAYVHPIDLLNLARTCKSLRNLLMDKCATFIWKTARQQERGLPDCPADLTEPEYANLAFYARCHHCGKYAKVVLWEIRRRYCTNCRAERLCTLTSCPAVIQVNGGVALLPTETITVLGELSTWVDKEHLESFINEHERASDKAQFFKDKREQRTAITFHARACEGWQANKEYQRKIALDIRRDERTDSIFERLKQLGYEREIAHIGTHGIQLSCKALFRKSKPLTDKEWAQIWPQWTETFDIFRSRRLEEVVHPNRRRLLASEYAKYVLSQSQNTCASDRLPHVVDVASFSPFRDLIRAPEGAPENLFQSAFARLPELVDEWKQKLDADVAELVKIPSHLSINGTADGQSVATGTESLPTATDRLRLACAMFRGDYGAPFTYPEVLSVCFLDLHFSFHSERELDRTGSVRQRYKIEYAVEAPYIIHACGLDPHVATADDMDRRNARLFCSHCQIFTESSRTVRVRRWRDAVLHAHFYHRSASLRWEVVGEQHMAAIQAAEQLLPNPPKLWRCLLCVPRVGDARRESEMTRHLEVDHEIKKENAEVGVHYGPFEVLLEMISVKMVEEGGNVTFSEPLRHHNGY